jgi:flagellin
MFRLSSPLQSNALTALNRTTALVAAAVQRVSSGLRINRAGDDPSGITISGKLAALIGSLQQANRNATSAISATQTADSAASNISDILTRLKELATEASDSTISSTTRSSIQTEADALLTEIDRIAGATAYGGQSLTASNTTISFFVGDGTAGNGDVLNVNLTNLSASSILAGVTSFQIASLGTATTALASVDLGVTTVGQVRTRFGVAEGRLEAIQTDIGVKITSLQEANSAIRDADIALEASNLVRAQILAQSGVYGLTQINLLPQYILPLFGISR